MNRPLSDKDKNGSPLMLVLVGLVGLVAFSVIFVRPCLKIIAARDWKATPCVINASDIRSVRGSKGTTYSVHIVYTYEAGGRKITGSRYHFMSGSSSGYSGKAAIVKRYPPGLHTTCYVNPRDPSDAVIERGFTSDILIGLLPLVFVAAAVWGLLARNRSAKRSAEAPWRPVTLQDDTDPDAIPTEPRELTPESSPVRSFVIFLLIALFWNGITSVFVYQALKSSRVSHGDWFGWLFSGGQMLFMIPFVLIGIVLIVAVCSSFLALFNPRVHLKISPGSVALGEPVALEWTIQGRSDRLSRFSITLEGIEEANYPNGKNMSTSNETFARIEIVTTTDRADFASGTARATLPRDSMHSFDTGHNKIKWKLIVKATIPRWPGVSTEYPLLVLPVRKGAVS